MIRTIYWFTIFWIIMVFSSCYNFKYKSLCKNKGQDEGRRYLEEIVSKWARFVVGKTGTEVHVTGVDNIPDETVLFVSNHQGYFDIPLLLGFVPKLKGFIAKKELKKIPLISSWMNRINCIFIDRGNPRESIKSIRKGVELLKEGNDLVIFPEGTRGKDSEVGEFKKGSLKLATKSKVPIVPITIDGSFNMLEERKRITKTKVYITIHPPEYTKDLSKEEESDLTDKLQQIVKSGMRK